jgi:hypothetical protein
MQYFVCSSISSEHFFFQNINLGEIIFARRNNRGNLDHHHHHHHHHAYILHITRLQGVPYTVALLSASTYGVNPRVQLWSLWLLRAGKCPPTSRLRHLRNSRGHRVPLTHCNKKFGGESSGLTPVL